MQSAHQPPAAAAEGSRSGLANSRSCAKLCVAGAASADEPTNHLDLEACVWLEEHLAKFKRILLMVSHSQVSLPSLAERGSSDCTRTASQGARER